jgi:hypothetical protein
VYGLHGRFEIMLRTLYNSDNLVMVHNLVRFLLSFFGSILHPDIRKEVVKEFYETTVGGKHVRDIFQSIKSRIKMGSYKIQNCTFEEC